MKATDEDLPGILGEIEEVAGRAAALKVAEHHGGTRIDIPATVGSDHWLAVLLGHEVACRIANHFRVGDPDGGEAGARHEAVPILGFSAFTSLAKEVRRGILADLQAGKGVRAIAREHHIHERTVWRWRARWKAEGLL